MAKVLAIGGAGFIGSHVVRALLGQGHEVTVVDNFSRYGYLPYDFHSSRSLTIVKEDVRALPARSFGGYDFVLCLAARAGGVRYLSMNAHSIMKDNTEILMHSLSSAHSSSPGSVFYFFSSSMVYDGNGTTPSTSYGRQKLSGELMVKSSCAQRGLSYVIVRPFNAVGAGEMVESGTDGKVEYGMSHVIPDFVYKTMIRQTPFEILGDGTQTRTFTHVNDIADAVALMIEKGTKNDDFDICGREHLTIIELAHRIWKSIHADAVFPEQKYLPAPDTDVRSIYGSYEKARERLGWEPKHTIDDMIADTVGFIKRHVPF
ncbi:MAG: NAD-dependent epimerase/dehydratase family protein [Deltaproteobacteria bacterium]|nr:NAD-dependent epimerase/dehydratase family protein [Deltaproteobacteria bacterium]MCL5277075.1 NAD-dependent epimerase/dehydratase family protein [Deltaproteobacteria bacterium]